MGTSESILPIRVAWSVCFRGVEDSRKLHQIPKDTAGDVRKG